MSSALAITGDQTGDGTPAAAIWEVNLAHELTAQLQALVLPLLPADDCRTELAGRLFRETLRCSASAMSRLQAAAAGGGSSVEGSDKAVDQRSSCCSGEKRKSSGRGADDVDEETPESRKMRRGKNTSHCCIATTVPYEDGYQWRKYGQKNISGNKYPRSYFRCTYSKEQRCPATKTVQQVDDAAANEDDEESYPPKFYVNYIMEHTCQQQQQQQQQQPVTASVVHGAEASSSSDTESRSTVDTNSDLLVQQQQYPSPSSVAVAAKISDTQEVGAPDEALMAAADADTAVKNPTAAAAAAYDLDMPWAKILDSLETSSQI